MHETKKNSCHYVQHPTQITYTKGLQRQTVQKMDYGESFEYAIQHTINYCIDHNILADILLKHESEVKEMLFTEFDEKAYKKQLRKESREEGLAEGIAEVKALAMISLIRKKAQKHISAEDCAELLEEDSHFVQEIYELLNRYPEKSEKEIYELFHSKNF